MGGKGREDVFDFYGNVNISECGEIRRMGAKSLKQHANAECSLMRGDDKNVKVRDEYMLDFG